MARSREGNAASYIGHERDLRGARCVVISDEGRYCHIRWVTGSRTGQIEAVREETLAPDHPTSPPSPFDEDDEFGFEEAPRRVGVACREVYEHGGLRALARTLEDAAYMGEVRILVHAAIDELHAAVRRSAAWSEIASDLGDDGAPVVAALVNEMVLEAIRGGAHEIG